MGLPHVLLVDDSEVILSFGRAALSGHYSVSSANNGREALEQLKRSVPALMLLDLSMPEMGGAELLQTVRADPKLASTPIIILSSEDHRSEECLRAGADAFIAKPVRAPELLATVNRVLSTSHERIQRGGMAILVLQVGPWEFGVGLESVTEVLSATSTIALPVGPHYLCELVDLRGSTVLVLDTAARLGTEYQRPAADRMFVVLAHGDRQLCLRADGVRDPEEIPADRLTPAAEIGAAQSSGLRAGLRAVARTDRGLVPILDAAALLDGETVGLLRDLVDSQLLHSSGSPGHRDTQSDAPVSP